MNAYGLDFQVHLSDIWSRLKEGGQGPPEACSPIIGEERIKDMEKRLYYLAYGSNLSVGQMAYRCPGAVIAGMAVIYDWKVAFKVHADIEPCKGRVVPVLVWEIGPDDEKALDRYEGYPRYYVKKDFKVTMTDLDGKDPREITAMAYVMGEGHDLKEPSDSYYRILEEGYRRFGFNSTLLELALHEARKGGRG